MWIRNVAWKATLCVLFALGTGYDTNGLIVGEVQRAWPERSKKLTNKCQDAEHRTQVVVPIPAATRLHPVGRRCFCSPIVDNIRINGHVDEQTDDDHGGTTHEAGDNQSKHHRARIAEKQQ